MCWICHVGAVAPWPGQDAPGVPPCTVAAPVQELSLLVWAFPEEEFPCSSCQALPSCAWEPALDDPLQQLLMVNSPDTTGA